MTPMEALQHELPARAAQMNEAIAVALGRLRWARRLADHIERDAADGWRKGLDDALKIVRDCREAHEAFERWVHAVAVLDQGITPAERELLSSDRV